MFHNMRQQALENSREYLSAALAELAPAWLSEKCVERHSPLFDNVQSLQCCVAFKNILNFCARKPLYRQVKTCKKQQKLTNMIVSTPPLGQPLLAMASCMVK